MTKLLYFNWNPITGWDIGPFTLHIYSLMFILAFSIGLYLTTLLFRKSGENTELIDPLFMYFFFGTLIGMRLGEVFFYSWDYFQDHLMEIGLPIRLNPNESFLGISGYEFTGFRGLASHGAFYGITIAMALFYYNNKSKMKGGLLWLYDTLAIPVITGAAFIRIGNFYNSEIIGKPSDLPWAVEFEQQSRGYGAIIPRHPSQLYEFFAYIFLALILYGIYKTKRSQANPGFLAGLFTVLLWTIRFFMEFLKESQGEALDSWGLNRGQELSLPLIVFGIGLMLYSLKRKK